MFRDSDTGEAVLARQSGFARSAALGSSLIRFARRKPLGAVGAASLAVPILVAILAPVIAPQDPYESFGNYVYAPPGSGGLLLGGDSLGRDVLSRLFYGARISLLVGVVSVTLGIGFGFIVGVISAYFGSWFDLLIQRIVGCTYIFSGHYPRLGHHGSLRSRCHERNYCSGSSVNTWSDKNGALAGLIR